MSQRAEFHVMGQPFDGKPLHYTASGLNYVYLLNGFSIEEDPDYGPLLTIQEVDDLHRAIGLYIIYQDRDLTGPEFRFLRKQMGFTQKELAPEMGVDVQTIANYEKGRAIPVPSQQLMRQVFAVWIMPEDERVSLLKQLANSVRHGRRGGKRTRRTARTRIGPPFVKQWQEGPLEGCPA
jgi:transcriptional regulator with XRE-family HTH domain